MGRIKREEAGMKDVYKMVFPWLGGWLDAGAWEGGTGSWLRWKVGAQGPRSPALESSR